MGLEPEGAKEGKGRVRSRTKLRRRARVRSRRWAWARLGSRGLRSGGPGEAAPAWMRWCRTRWVFRLKLLPHCGQGKAGAGVHHSVAGQVSLLELKLRAHSAGVGAGLPCAPPGGDPGATCG